MHFFKTKVQIATFIALLFHICGLVAIVYFKSKLFINLTPLNLLISFLLLLWTQEKINIYFLIFLFLCFSVGSIVEWVGIHTNKLFGQYSYGEALGPKWKGVPWMIGINWFITIYCIGIALNRLHHYLASRRAGATPAFGKPLTLFSIVIDGAMLAVFFDWIIEPVAVRFGFWTWENGVVPIFNYVCWFGISALILFIFQLFRFSKHNLFAVHLLLIQIMFFLLLRTLL